MVASATNRYTWRGMSTNYRIAGLPALLAGTSGEERVRIIGLEDCQRYEQVHLERNVYELEDCMNASATNRYIWRGRSTHYRIA